MSSAGPLGAHHAAGRRLAWMDQRGAPPAGRGNMPDGLANSHCRVSMTMSWRWGARRTHRAGEVDWHVAHAACLADRAAKPKCVLLVSSPLPTCVRAVPNHYHRPAEQARPPRRRSSSARRSLSLSTRGPHRELRERHTAVPAVKRPSTHTYSVQTAGRPQARRCRGVRDAQTTCIGK